MDCERIVSRCGHCISCLMNGSQPSSATGRQKRELELISVGSSSFSPCGIWAHQSLTKPIRKYVVASIQVSMCMFRTPTHHHVLFRFFNYKIVLIQNGVAQPAMKVTPNVIICEYRKQYHSQTLKNNTGSIPFHISLLQTVKKDSFKGRCKAKKSKSATANSGTTACTSGTLLAIICTCSDNIKTDSPHFVEGSTRGF